MVFLTLICFILNSDDALTKLSKERNYRMHIQRVLMKQERTFSAQQKDQMRMVEKQLKEQESFILGIKLNLANLNKNYMQSRSELKRE